jgi:DNA-binding CsgD family transcriptional regulator/PAS domain-containing protein
MSETPDGGEEIDRHARWVAMWRTAVRSSPLAVGLVDLMTTRFVEMSDGAATLLNTTPQDGVGVEYLSVTARPIEAAQTFQLVRERTLDGLEGRRRFAGAAGGAEVELQVTGWAIRSRGGFDLGLWLAHEVPLDDRATAADAQHPVTPRGDFDRAEMVLDGSWRIARLHTDTEVLLGRPAADWDRSSLLELTHPADSGDLLFAFARSTTDTSAQVVVRLRHADQGWRPIRLVVTLTDGDVTSPFSLAATPVAAPERSEATDASQLAGDLRRIASQIETAGILAPLMETATTLGVPASADLSPRQWEIASRLVQGERVPTIAAELQLSQSTVRNHLSAIYEKFGVHSQPELLALWRARAKASGSPTL